MAWAAGPAFRRRAEVLSEGVLGARVVFFADVFFKVSPFMRVNED